MTTAPEKAAVAAIAAPEYHPKGGMCFSCAKMRNDCSRLPFSTMPVVRQYEGAINIVRCTEYQKNA